MGWRLASGTGYCEVAGELVFFDARRNKYFALRGDARAAFERLLMGHPNDSDAMTRLVRTELFVRCDGPNSLPSTSISVPTRDLSAEEEGFSLVMAMQIGRALYWAKKAMRPERIASTLGELERKKRKLAVPGAEAMVVDYSRRFAACRWLAPVPPRCLVDALALDKILISRGLLATLVFGLRLHPFAAHCWLQSPETILTGTAADARNFTPILAVG